MISLNEYQCENEKKKLNYNNQIKFLTYAKITNFFIYVQELSNQDCIINDKKRYLNKSRSC